MSSTSVPTDLQPFTWKTYELYLRVARESGYQFLGFDTLKGNVILPAYPFILLRHDIDYDPVWALPISKIEAENHIRATYFFQVDSPFYKLECAETISVVEEILGQGHWLGVHFDANRLKDDRQVTEEVERTAAIFETRFGVRTPAVSFHMPTYRPVKHLCLTSNRINTYSSVFFESIAYFSDSNQDWRGKDILKALREQQYGRIQLLIHPIWWREVYSPFSAKLDELARKLNISLESILTREQQELLANTKTP